MWIVALIRLWRVVRRFAGIRLCKPLRILADCIIYHRMVYQKFQKSFVARFIRDCGDILTELFLEQTRRHEPSPSSFVRVFGGKSHLGKADSFSPSNSLSLSPSLSLSSLGVSDLDALALELWFTSVSISQFGLCMCPSPDHLCCILV